MSYSKCEHYVKTAQNIQPEHLPNKYRNLKFFMMVIERFKMDENFRKNNCIDKHHENWFNFQKMKPKCRLELIRSFPPIFPCMPKKYQTRELVDVVFESGNAGNNYYFNFIRNDLKKHKLHLNN